MLAILDTAVVSGLRGELVRVEVDVAPGLPGCHIVGLPDTALSEARERVRSAIRNAGFAYPLSRITVNLAPADRRKHGAAYDVAIAIGILLAFTAVCAGVLVLRRTMPETPRPFRVPFAPLTCTAGVLMCLALTAALPHDTWVRLLIWSAIGFALYFGYGFWHSKLHPQK